MIPGLALALTLVTLAALGLAVAVLRLQRHRDVLRLERDALAERSAARERDQAGLRETFEALSARALKSSNEEFLRLANETLKAREGKAIAEMDKRRAAIDGLVGPIREALERTHEKIGRVEKSHVGMKAHIDQMVQANQELRAETGRLTQALRKPNVRGRYGEIQLERVVELAGMRRWCDFTPQENLRDDDKRLLKPDCVVRLPNSRVIAIDAKTSFDAYLDAVDTEDEAARDALLDRYAQNVFEQVQKLARKEYWAQFESLEMVVMFVPGDQLVDAALERRPELVEVAADQNVVIASPSTLIGLLRAVHVGWREKELSDNAEELFRLGRELHERAAIVLEHAAKVGDSLDNARKRYNEFVGSVDSRLVPTLRKFEEHGARSARSLEGPTVLEGEPRELRSREALGETLFPPPPKEALPAPSQGSKESKKPAS